MGGGGEKRLRQTTRCYKCLGTLTPTENADSVFLETGRKPSLAGEAMHSVSRKRSFYPGESKKYF